jgi:hypothetical protein
VITRKDPRITLVRSRLFLREQFYGISDLVDPRHAAALQFGATLGLLSSDASVLRGRLVRRFPTSHHSQMAAKVPSIGS